MIQGAVGKARMCLEIEFHPGKINSMRHIGLTSKTGKAGVVPGAIGLLSVQLFLAPATLKQWESRREQIRGELWRLLGKLPTRPNVPAVEVTNREDFGDYSVERFRFDNGAGATVPGCIFLPRATSAKSPAILY